MNTIQQIRTSMGLTQTKLAEKIGVTQATVAAWEKGMTYPSLKHLASIRELGQMILRKDWRDAYFFEPPRQRRQKNG